MQFLWVDEHGNGPKFASVNYLVALAFAPKDPDPHGFGFNVGRQVTQFRNRNPGRVVVSQPNAYLGHVPDLKPPDLVVETGDVHAG